MTKAVKILIALLVTITIMIALGVLSMRVGGVSIRSASQTYKMGILEVANSVLLPGVPVTVGINIESLREIKTSPKLLLRLSSGTVVMGEITRRELTEGAARVVLPCSSGSGQVRLVLVDGVTQNILAQSDSLTILAPGPDCL
jgi:hypothetical protein